MELLKTYYLTKTYGTGEASVKALKSTDLVIEKGEFTAIVEPSGSGKITLLHLLAGLDKPSAGHQQRVSIARALSNKPSIIFADEPTGNLDSKNSKEVLELLTMSIKKFNQTLVMITHDPKVAACADRIITISDGEIIEDTRVI
ncbi:MAG: ABC transporter ATP-binding protein [Clostridium sp.]|uniref:ABC transporter ATP-binding protein n=1 Tax=Clostridium sp. TaxID=1506 RepID=UPI003D6CEEED